MYIYPLIYHVLPISLLKSKLVTCFTVSIPADPQGEGCNAGASSGGRRENLVDLAMKTMVILISMLNYQRVKFKHSVNGFSQTHLYVWQYMVASGFWLVW